MHNPFRKVLPRRTFLAGLTATLAAPAVLRVSKSFASSEPVRIGFVTPQTGPLAFFGEPDPFILKRFEKLIAAGIATKDVTRPVEFVIKDSQSSANRASEVASQLILDDNVDLLIAAGGPDTVNPVADQAEVNGVPMVANSCPWQPFVFGRNSTPEKGFDWSWLFAFGLEDVIAAYLALWQTIETNKKVGMMFANDADGNAWGNAEFGFPAALAKAGYQGVDAGRYTPMADDFTAQITAFKKAGVDIVVATMVPPEFFAFWTQAAQQGFKPKVASIGKTLLLPKTLQTIGGIGNGLSAEVSWHRTYPYRSAATGETPESLCSAWEQETGRQWIQLLGSKHALFEIALDVLARSGDPSDRDAVVGAIKATDHETVAGRVKWEGSPIKNVTKMPIVGGQWMKSGDKFELIIRANPTKEPIAASGGLVAL
ncbi:ABC transporter substrate-binding protein [Mesorhizobium sp. J428]|uniref:ABC transporter substrate-binding protein n=1 Tax=Mesorhizobium sp. J428 TaxID=2898440 RepID=UPI002151889F|nr:ABC transporter substrate-binding protein [Mesorhizobium sp. J428]MCR5855758.1 ABC transporter substrate-binding protein [Mesorhizobium sp. J428]